MILAAAVILIVITLIIRQRGGMQQAQDELALAGTAPADPPAVLQAQPVSPSAQKC